jgi:hypothetical protein
VARISVPVENWTSALPQAIRDAEDDDVLLVDTEAKKELGETAHKRMCPEKHITFEVVPMALRN